MSALKDMTGSVVGKLTVLRRHTNDDCGMSRWLCSCACGQVAIVSGKALRRQTTKSCGCGQHAERGTEDLSGRKFGRLTVLKKTGKDRHGKPLWLCECECGNNTVVNSNALKRKNTKSCGCIKLERISGLRRTHGLSRTPEYVSWAAMKSRCYYKASKHYGDYGGRGISVCNRWRLSFEAFLSDMGPRPFPEATVERKNVNGQYSPSNCIWATKKTQARNKRTSHLLTINGETRCIGEWAELRGIDQRRILARLRLGWEPEEAVDPTKRTRWSRKTRT